MVVSPPAMTEAELLKISTFVENEFGIRMPREKKPLLEGRLAKRVVATGQKNYGQYLDFVTRDPAGRDEYLVFADLVSTHETSFFREPGHLNFLEKWVPEWRRRNQGQQFQLLSAACSTGEEAYSAAMVLDAAFEAEGDLPRYQVEGIDISDRAVGIAQRGVYLAEPTRKIPQHLSSRYLMEGMGTKAHLRRFVPELRGRMLFHMGNLLGAPGFQSQRYDVIFCRNVLIYFDAQTQKQVLGLLLSHLRDDGLLILGHSETMAAIEFPVRSLAPAVYQPKGSR
jgi:chemotaxis protein methyltransferase CheR